MLLRGANNCLSAGSDGSFWTYTFPGNLVFINIWSSGLMTDFDGGLSEFHILEIERSLVPGSDRDDIPQLGAGNDDYLPMSNGHISTGSGATECGGRGWGWNQWSLTLLIRNRAVSLN